jgi:molecular chaperone DnaK
VDIDANGIMHVSAKDKATGKENKITIKSSSGLSEAEIQAMIKDAEANAEADKKTRVLIETRNGAEAQMNQIEKDLKDYGDALSEEEKSKLGEAFEATRKANEGDDPEAITKAIGELITASQILVEKKNQAETQKTTVTEEGETVMEAEFKETK